MLDNQKLPTQILEASFVFRQQHAGGPNGLFSGRRSYIVLPGPVTRNVDTALHYDWLTSRSVREALSWTREALSLKRLCPLCLCPRGQRVTTLQSHSICHHDDISQSPPPPTRLLTHCFMTSTINDIPTFGKCWSHSVSLLSQLAKDIWPNIVAVRQSQVTFCMSVHDKNYFTSVNLFTADYCQINHASGAHCIFATSYDSWSPPASTKMFPVSAVMCYLCTQYRASFRNAKQHIAFLG